ncbi:putative F-box protein [Acanthamoeba castellanii mimivirus]|uniref:Putative F-box protein L165 n=5 Tax=Mimivirus TaxID=315393 RepID=YL165_MIMIV|nr:putative F-box protein [Acanthamoeba polyphaga mimivirus]Q5UP35.1 RecName: Full=Putative F-box protein L165 [Acanthamoeba polyphaga mimivirus]AHJ39942.1 F-box protein [Samba virus]ALR83676.1 putative F-box protein [Niemeyer virus]AMZ02613.1 putative F-box protein [Mimivirus Bombay]BAV61252.1 putative F-box protein [Acanthamoeba castellanii mimivirus]AAV50439.1 unknown [Acanthamoeba polyphaga mimivirus]
MENICELFDDVILEIMNLLSDTDKINFMFCCSRFYYFIDLVYYNDIYDYYKIQNVSFINKFKKIRYLAVTDTIPSVITHLELDKSFVGSLENCQLPKLSCLKLTQLQYDSFKIYISPAVKIDILKLPTYLKYIDLDYSWDIETYSNSNNVIVKRLRTDFICPVENREGPKCGLMKTSCISTNYYSANYYQYINSQQTQLVTGKHHVPNIQTNKSVKQPIKYSSNTKSTINNIFTNILNNIPKNIPKYTPNNIPKIVPKNTHYRNSSKKYRY